jgi:hypothetical protein
MIGSRVFEEGSMEVSKKNRERPVGMIITYWQGIRTFTRLVQRQEISKEMIKERGSKAALVTLKEREKLKNYFKC